MSPDDVNPTTTIEISPSNPSLDIQNQIMNLIAHTLSEANATINAEDLASYVSNLFRTDLSKDEAQEAIQRYIVHHAGTHAVSLDQAKLNEILEQLTTQVPDTEPTETTTTYAENLEPELSQLEVHLIKLVDGQNGNRDEIIINKINSMAEYLQDPSINPGAFISLTKSIRERLLPELKQPDRDMNRIRTAAQEVAMSIPGCFTTLQSIEAGTPLFNQTTEVLRGDLRGLDALIQIIS